MECDFCSNPNIVRCYHCMDFLAESEKAGVLYAHPEGPINVKFESVSYWAACAECARFVDDEDIDGLIVHAVTTLCKDRDIGDVQKQNFIRHLEYVYALFFKTRIRIQE